MNHLVALCIARFIVARASEEMFYSSAPGIHSFYVSVKIEFDVFGFDASNGANSPFWETFISVVINTSASLCKLATHSH